MRWQNLAWRLKAKVNSCPEYKLVVKSDIGGIWGVRLNTRHKK